MARPEILRAVDDVMLPDLSGRTWQPGMGLSSCPPPTAPFFSLLMRFEGCFLNDPSVTFQNDAIITMWILRQHGIIEGIISNH